MTYAQLDSYFPFVVLFYGLLTTFFLHSDFFQKLAEQRLTPALWRQFQAHRALGLVCLVIGALWSLQNILTVPFS